MSKFQPLDTLTALNEAALAIAEGLSLPHTLQRIADTARTLIQSKYAALGVLAGDGPRLKQFITSGMEPQMARHIHHEPIGAGLLGEVFVESQPVNVPKIADDPRSAGFCDNHPPMASFLGAPITNRGKHLGNLYLCDRLDGQPFDKDDEELLTLLAAHAAIAIENAKLHEELQVAALRSERDRIGMELHDGVIQSIYAVGMKIDILRANIGMSKKDEPQFQIVLEDLNHIIDDIRAYIRNLAMARDEQVALKSHIENLGAHFHDFSGVKVTGRD
jgi:GAF domain-containing protein